MKFKIWCDGGCSGNPGPGAYAAIIKREDGNIVEVSGIAELTTNNQMELAAVYHGLRQLPKESQVIVYTDSRDVIGWLNGTWKRRNPGIIKACRGVDEVIAVKNLTVTWEHVAGHAGNEMNERADAIVKTRIKEIKKHAPPKNQDAQSTLL